MSLIPQVGPYAQVPTTPVAHIALKELKASVPVAAIVIVLQVAPFVFKALKALPLISVVAQMPRVAPSAPTALMTIVSL